MPAAQIVGNSSTSSSAALTVSGGTSTFGGVIQNTLGGGNQTVALTVGGGGNLTLTGANTYTGMTTVNSGGLLQIGNGSSGEQIASQTIADAGSLVFNHGDALTFSGTIGGGGSLAQLGSGLLTLTGTANTWSGGTTISNGTLQVGDGAATNGSIAGNIVDNANLVFAYPAASTYGGGISGTGAVRKTGAGTLTLSAFQSYTGGTTVNSGTLGLANGNNGTGIIRGTLTINPGAEVNIITHDVFGYSGYATSLGTLNINGGTLNQSYGGNETLTAVTVNMTGGVWSSSVAGGYFDLFTNGSYNNSSGTINTVPSSTTAVISTWLNFRSYTALFNVPAGTTPSGVDLLVSGQLTGGYGLTKLGNGLMLLTATNSNYPGTNTVNGGTLQVGSNAALGANSNALTIAGGAVLDLHGFSPGVGVLNGSGLLDNSASGGSPTLTIGNGGGSGTFSGVIQNSTGTVAVAKTGAGTEVLSGSNTFNGPLSLNGGIINFANGYNLGSGNPINFNGGELQYALGSTYDITTGRTVSVNTSGGTIDTGGNNVTLANSIGGAGALTKVGAGVLVLANTNSYGSTQVQNGTLLMGTANALPATGTVTLGAAGTTGIFDLAGFNQQIAGLSLGSGSHGHDAGRGQQQHVRQRNADG